jgi:REP element-mobilizing transposase RayT
MARPLRIQFPGAIYHLTTRGVDRQPIFRDRDDRLAFLRLLDGVATLDEFRIHAFCLMTNHVHLLVETPRGNVGTGMHRLLHRHARRFNHRHGRRGHLFEERYGSSLLRSEEHLLSAARYIALNPVRAGLCDDPAAWPWSSHRATAGLGPRPRFLVTDWLLGVLDARPEVAHARYRDFIGAGTDTIGA